MTTQQQRILDAIPYGEENAIKASVLAVRIGLSKNDSRLVRKEIQQMRLKGKLIASTTHPP